MSDSDKNDPLEFSALDLMPSWAKETSDEKPKQDIRSRRAGSEDDRGGDRRGGRGGDRRGRDDRRGGGGGGNRGFRDDRRGGQGGGHGGGGGRRFENDRRGGGGGGRGGRRDDRRDGGRGRDRRPQEEPVPEGIVAKVQPTVEAAGALAKHIQETIRAYPLIDLAKMVLGARERYEVTFESKEGKKAPLYQCKSDGSAWLTREEAVSHMLKSDALNTYYRIEEVDVGPPKGNFNSVAVCGMSGEILGPPNHHEYQKNVAKMQAERFSHMSLERYKSRINMANDEETIEKWKEQASRKRHYRLVSDEEAEPEAEEPVAEESTESKTEEAVAPEQVDGEAAASEEEVAESESAEATAETETEPPGEENEEVAASEEETSDSREASEETADAEPEPVAEEEPKPEALVLKSETELNRHFREHFAPLEIVEALKVTVNGNISGRNLSRGLLTMLKQETEKLRRGFPLPMIQELCRALEKENLRFFKRGKKSLHVAVTRPRALTNAESLTERIQQIVTFITENPRSLVLDLLDSLVDDFQKPDEKDKEAKVNLTEDAKDVLKDLRWLTSEGYVLEFPDTRLSLGKVNGPEAAKGGAAGDGQSSPDGAKKKRKRNRKKKAPGAVVSPEGESQAKAVEPETKVVAEESPVEEKPVETTPIPEESVAEKSEEVAPVAEKSEPVAEVEKAPDAEPVVKEPVIEAEPEPSESTDETPSEEVVEESSSEEIAAQEKENSAEA